MEAEPASGKSLWGVRARRIIGWIIVGLAAGGSATRGGSPMALELLAATIGAVASGLLVSYLLSRFSLFKS